MFVSDCLSVNEAGHLTIGSADTVELARTYGTPLYVFDEGTIRETLRQYKGSIDRYYGGKGLVAYASKAFACKEIYRIVESEGCGIDVVSRGELYTALSVGFPVEKIFYHGNNKTVEELTYAIEHNVGRIVVDNLTELERISAIAISQNKVVPILLRIKPGIDAHTHNFVRTGQIDSKFGFALETGEALDAVRYALTHPGVALKGIHCHIGSQIFEIDPFECAAEVMIGFMAAVRDETGLVLTELNLGGGFGIKYVPENDPVPYQDYMEKVSGMVHTTCRKYGLETPFIAIEPGRSVVGSAGITLYTVGGVKVIPNIRTYVSVDGGMTDNPRYILYQSQYEAVLANRAADPKDSVITLAGRCCESGDLVGEGMPIQSPKVDDIIAVLATGAYNYSMASNYNRVPRPAAIMVRDGQVREIIRRESMEDLARNDL
ncbi:MAG: diaminopimelate decarboxylase [Oscillospiraceae bacterium]|nr:diaminopimelate decarboxylase [Oscillospiraceae bacterium]SFI94226.1 diaminopimelate decarboxylase [Ruminococcaceae bacterium D5]